MPAAQTLYLDIDRDFEIRPQPAGGFVLRQYYYTDEKEAETGNRIACEFQRAFSTAGDIIDFLNESYNFPRHIASQAYTPAKTVT